jgi:hypothetical protein
LASSLPSLLLLLFGVALRRHLRTLFYSIHFVLKYCYVVTQFADAETAFLLGSALPLISLKVHDVPTLAFSDCALGGLEKRRVNVLPPPPFSFCLLPPPPALPLLHKQRLLNILHFLKPKGAKCAHAAFRCYSYFLTLCSSPTHALISYPSEQRISLPSQQRGRSPLLHPILFDLP